MDNCTYTNSIFTKHIKEKIDVIFECGSRDGIDSIKMFEFYKPQKIFCFECNPDSVKICEENLSNKKDIILQIRQLVIPMEKFIFTLLI